MDDKISAIQDITSKSMMNPGGFDFTKTLGTFIQNRDFEIGHQRFLGGQDDRSTYIWNALSAIANDLGEVTFSNIRNYIDEVSNVDTCKVKALNSMLQSFGLDFRSIGQIDKYPVEVLNLMDILSMDPKFLVNNSKIRNDLVERGIVPKQLVKDGLLYDIEERCNQDGRDSIDMSGYQDYVKDVFHELLMSFLQLRYNTDNPNISAIFSYVKNEYLLDSAYYDKYFNSDLMEFKKQNGITPSFDEKNIVDDIECGKDSLDNYSGAELELLNMVLDSRRGMLLKDNTDGSVVNAELKTRYSYYRKAKVLEYAKFIDDMYATKSLSVYGNYALDPNYGNVQDSNRRVFIFPDSEEPRIDTDIVDQVADSLMQSTAYIQRLRKKLKLQTRKNYMKGTLNLLVYVINQFLVDYSRTSNTLDLSRISAYGTIKGKLQKIKENLTYSDSNDVDIIEYYDTTEYYNLQTGSSSQSNDDQTNPHFKDEYFRKLSDGTYDKDAMQLGLDFTLDEIQEFYMSSLNLASGIENTTDGFIRFLDTIYTAGSDDSFIDQNGNFSYRISSDPGTGIDFYASDMYQEFTQLRETFQKYRNFLSDDDYEYPDAPISDQISNVLDEHLYTKLSVQYLSAISSVYDEFRPMQEQLESKLEEISSKYTDFVESDENKIYLDKNDCKYSYEGNVYGGEYKHDYYNNHLEKYNSKYLIDKFGDLRIYTETEDNIVTHQVIDTLEYTNQTFTSISSRLMTDVGSVLEKYGYVDVKSIYMETEMDSMTAFIEQYIQSRKDDVNNQIQEIKNQANELKDTYDQLDASLDAALAAHSPQAGGPQGADSFFIFGECKNTGECTHPKWFGKNSASITSIRAKAEKEGKQLEEVVQGYLMPSAEGGQVKKWIFYRFEDEDLNNNKKAKYDLLQRPAKENGFGGESITDRASSFKAWLETITSALVVNDGQGGGGQSGGGDDWDDDDWDDEDFGDSGSDCYLDESSAWRAFYNPGTAAALESIIEGVKNLDKSTDRVIEEINELGYNFSATGSELDKIEDLLKYVGSEMQTDFQNDNQIKELTNCKNKITALRTEFTDLQHDYQDLESFEGYKQELTLENIAQFKATTENIDSRKQTQMLDAIDEAISSYYVTQSEYTSIGNQIHEKLPTYYPQATHLEIELDDLKDQLIASVEELRDAGNQKIVALMDDLRYYIDILKNYIPGKLSSMTKFEDEISSKIDELDYFKWDDYKDNYEIFRTYIGSSDGYEPFYNHKNITHASYQIHPFLWKFISAKKVKDILSRSINSFFNDRLESRNIAGHIDNIVGEFGQVINIWENNTVDYSGYTTRYETSQHVGANVGYSPVVDYDGGFYPPAVEDYVKNHTVAARTVYENLTKDDFFIKYVKKNVFNASPNMIVSSMELLQNALSDGPSFFSDFDVSEVAKRIDERYPLSVQPHLEMLRNTILDEIPETFFEKYYSHLPLRDSDNREREFIAKQLSNDYIFEKISAITETKTTENDVYDIYRYGMDQYDNMYVLYKKYDVENPSYGERRDTPGQLWIRKSNHPIAFPAILPNDLSQLQAVHKDSGMNVYLQSRVYKKDETTEKYCFDFGFSDNKEILALVVRGTQISDAVFDRYEYGDVAFCKIEQKFDETTEMREILKLHNEGGRFDELVMPQDRPSEAEITELSSKTYTSFLGMYSPGSTDIRLVYADKDMRLISESQVSVVVSNPPQVYVAFFGVNQKNIMHEKAKDTYSTIRINTFTNGTRRIPSGQDIVFSYNSEEGDENLIFAFETQKSERIFPEYKKDKPINQIVMSDGNVFEDATQTEMNSFDTFVDDVMLAKVSIYSRDIRDKESARSYNTNADISYQPIYPGEDFSYKLKNGKDYENIQLMGFSKDITKWTDSINENPNPFIELSDIIQNHVFGRVYEHYENNLSDQIAMFENPTFGGNTKSESFRPIDSASGGRYFYWNIDLGGRYNFNEDSSNIVFFNKGSLGKNPYCSCRLSEIKDKLFQVAYDFDRDNSEIQISGNDDCTIVGTQNQYQSNYMDTNIIYNIKDIEIRYDSVTKSIGIWFWFKNTKLPTSIEDGTLRVILYDDQNITQFQNYHLLDAYGVVNVYNAYTNEEIYGQVLSGDGWTITYDKKDLTEKEIARLDSAIEIDGGRVFLKDIELSNYGFLSSVYLFNQHKVAFKYNDEHRFPFSDAEYFYPFLNRKYPTTPAKFFSENMQFGKNQTEFLSSDIEIFDDKNLFFMQIDENERILSSLGKIQIPIIQNFQDDEDVIMVYEDFLSSYEEVVDGQTISVENKTRYSVDDPNIMRFVQFCAVRSQIKDIEQPNDLSVDDALIEGKTLDEFGEMIGKFKDQNYYPFKISTEKSSIQTYVVAEPTVENTSLEKLLKIHVNYKKEDNGTITLFFNCENYINTPYVKIDGGRVYSDIIPGTYLKLNGGESGNLDIVAQFRYYSGDELFGYRNIKLLSYKISNLSDDKPKFMIKNTYIVENDSENTLISNPQVKIKVNSLEIDCNKIILDNPQAIQKKYEFHVDIDIISNIRISRGSYIEIEYPTNIMRPVEGNYSGYGVVNDQLGTTKIVIANRDISKVRLYYETPLVLAAMTSYGNRKYGIEISDVNISTISGKTFDVTSSAGTISIMNSKEYGIHTEDGISSVVDESGSGQILAHY